ncbi:MAG TPA: permease-like cell division protein FtsX [Candidatus Dormibacteraeota bacterium]|nr:permease-like cell division protein FtsX [Candidatus Dormibacteraeota bacterium]
MLASLRFAVVSAGQNFYRNLAVSLAAVFTMGLILLLVGMALLGTHMLNQVLTDEQARASNIKVYLQDGVSLASVNNLQQQLAADPRISAVHFENKDDAANELRNHDLGVALDAVGSNPLPASLNLDLRRLADLPDIDAMVRTNAIVDRGSKPTSYNPDVIGKLQTLIRVLQIIAVVIAAVLGVISLVIIMNTIRTAVYVRRREIEIMKLVGATDWFVRWPFILEGVLGGILAALLAGGVIAAFYKPAVSNLKSTLFIFPLTYDGSFLSALILMLVAGGGALGAFGSYLGVRRFLSV